MITVILLGALVISGLYIIWTRRELYKISWQLKGPTALPFIGCAWMIFGKSHEGELPKIPDIIVEDKLNSSQ